MAGAQAVSKESLHLGKVLGQGSFAECRLARLRRAPGSVLCMKELLKNRSSESETEAFEREIDFLQSIEHPYIVKLVGRSDSPDSSFMLLEFLRGGTLRKMILQQMATTSKLYSDRDVLRWCTQLASALVCLHTRSDPVMHRDVHPDNVTLTDSRAQFADIRLIDFGLHRTISEGSQGSMDPLHLIPCVDSANDLIDPVKRSRATFVPLTGQTGAYMYMSPEMVLYEQYGTPTDIYSFGCVMYELYTRTIRSVLLCALQPDPNGVIDYAHKVAEGFRPEISSRVPAGVAEVIRQCWEQDPAARPTAPELLASLQRLGGSALPAGVASLSLSRSKSGGAALPCPTPGFSQKMRDAFMRRVSVL